MWKFWVTLLAALFCLLVYLGARGEAAESEHWPSTPGVITRMDVSEQRDREGNYTKKLEVRYTYSVNGQKLEGDRIGVGMTYDTDAAARTYPVGREVVVFYNPKHPDSSVLQTGGGGTMIWAVGSLALFAISLFVFREERRKRLTAAVSAA